MTDSPDVAAVWLGRVRIQSDTLDERRAIMLAATLDVPAPGAGDPLPPLWHWAWFNEAVRPGELGRDGHPAPGVVLPSTGVPRRMWAGGRLAFHRPLRVGAEVTRTSSITAITPREGRSGRLVFVTQHAEIADADGPCLTDEVDLVYRAEGERAAVGPFETPARSSPAPQGTAAGTPAPQGLFGVTPDDREAATRGVRPDAVQLFRYSALTFNGHRIHYDADYARQVEGYPGVVIHGPLIATWLAALAQERLGALRTFSYRGVRASTLGMTLGLHAATDASGATRLWATQPDGGVTMQAEATGPFAMRAGPEEHSRACEDAPLEGRPSRVPWEPAGD